MPRLYLCTFGGYLQLPFVWLRCDCCGRGSRRGVDGGCRDWKVQRQCARAARVSRCFSAEDGRAHCPFRQWKFPPAHRSRATGGNDSQSHPSFSGRTPARHSHSVPSRSGKSLFHTNTQTPHTPDHGHPNLLFFSPNSPGLADAHAFYFDEIYPRRHVLTPLLQPRTPTPLASSDQRLRRRTAYLTLLRPRRLRHELEAPPRILGSRSRVRSRPTLAL